MTNSLTDALRRSVRHEMKQRNSIGDRLEYLRQNPHKVTPYDVRDLRDMTAHADYLLAKGSRHAVERCGVAGDGVA